MAATPETIVLDSAHSQLEHAEASRIRGQMLQESLGSVGKNLMDIMTQYENVKGQQQKQDLASLTMAGTLSGGMDKLPQDVKNKIPGIIGYNLPTDEQGNVQITPDTDTVLKRMTLDLLQKDPNRLAIAAGLRDKESDPFALANKVKIQDMQDASKSADRDAANARNQLTNSTTIDKTLMEARAKIDAANIAAGAKGKSADDAPSPYILDPSTNSMVTESQWYSAHPGQQPPQFLNLKDAKIINQTNMVNSSNAARNSEISLNQSRLRALDFKTNTMMQNPDPNNMDSKQFKYLVDAVRLSRGQPSEAGVNAMVAREMPKILSRSGFDKDSIDALTTTAGNGGWHNYILNMWNTAQRTASPFDPYNIAGTASLLQPSTDHISGVSSVPGTGGTVGGVQSSATPGAPTPGNALSVEDFQRMYPRQ